MLNLSRSLINYIFTFKIFIIYLICAKTMVGTEDIRLASETWACPHGGYNLARKSGLT